MAKKFTVIYGTNVTIPDKKGNPKVITFFGDVEGKDQAAVEWEVSQKIMMNDFILDNGGYWRRTSIIVSFKVEERLEVKNNITWGKEK